MKPFALLSAIMLLGACASAPAPAPAPVPVPTPEPDTVVAPAPEPVPAVIEVVPDRWWLLDGEADGVYGASVDRAYRELLAGREPERTIIVAIIDSGVDIEHEDLQGNLWQNPRETPNARDDDGDGLVDDISGWNFIGGPDGSHVDDDTYEITRLYAACRQLMRNGGAAPPEPVTADECPAIGRAFDDKVAETAAMLEQISELYETVEIVMSILQQHVGQDSLTEERVRAITPVRSDVQQARSIYLQLADAGITQEQIEDELDRLERLLEFGLNPDFDPRPMVGDNYGDPTERVYGNLDVTGPDASHGTGVAGIVAAVRGNDLGIDGIASGVRIMAIRAVPNGDERDKDVANAIRYAVDHGAHIINMSFGKAWSPFKEVVDDAVRYAEERGVLMIHAAGNDGKDLTTEPNFPNRYFASGDTARLWIEVGASGWEGAGRLAAQFSNYGSANVDVFAPGSRILSLVPGDDYREASGTSFAAPVVSGIAALLMAYYPELSAADVRRIILESATPLRDHVVVRPGELGGEVRFGELSVTGAIVNAYNAVRMADRLRAARN